VQPTKGSPPMMPTRRQILEQIGGTLAVSSVAGALAPRLSAAPRPSAAPARRTSTTPTLVVVYLRGGADALSIVAPYDDKHYPRHRPSLALARPDSGSGAVLPLDDQFGFNPNLKELYELFGQGLCVPFVAIGSPHGTRSHF